MKKIYKAIIVAFALLVLIPLIFFMILFGINLSTVHLDTSMLNSYNSKITLYDRDSTPIIQTSPTGQNTVNLNELPQYVIDAFIATEDKRFYEHNGINIGRIIKATFTNIINGYAKEGASTITQQLIKNTHLSSEKTLDRKVKEILLALQLEKEYTKDEILSTYFNILYFGHNIYGLQDASTIYFGHDATELTLWESATLAEGGIQLKKDGQTYTLQPGQQAYMKQEQEQVKVREVDLKSAIAWRYNAFSFEEAPLEEIMNELSRWYNIHVFYLNPKVKELHFTAWFRRNSTLEEVIDVLNKTDKIHVELKGKTITVTQKQ